MASWLTRFLWRRQRNIDIEMLWPILKEQAAGDIDRARQAFYLHAVNDDCWFCEFGEDKLWDEVMKLK